MELDEMLGEVVSANGDDKNDTRNVDLNQAAFPPEGCASSLNVEELPKKRKAAKKKKGVMVAEEPAKKGVMFAEEPAKKGVMFAEEPAIDSARKAALGPLVLKSRSHSLFDAEKPTSAEEPLKRPHSGRMRRKSQADGLKKANAMRRKSHASPVDANSEREQDSQMDAKIKETYAIFIAR
jgi:hypothetical protein